LGSGEIILWPYLASNYGLGIVWGIVIGITMQFFINMEVERYALINGESVFVGFARLLKWLPAWFIVSTFLGFGWPGIGLSGATLLASALHIGNVRLVGVILFLLIGAFLSIGKVLYKSVEELQKILIGFGVPFIVLLTFYMADGTDIVALGKGILGQGDGYSFLPTGLAFGTLIGTFLGALAYAGAGGNLNLTQSCYVRDKGYGMGKYADKITSLFSAKGKQRFRLTGTTFPTTKENLENYRKWWKMINTEHALVFWGLGLFTMLTLSLLAYITVYGSSGDTHGINFVIAEAAVIGQKTYWFIGSLFLIVTGIMLTKFIP
jgi:hypothetical protein